MARICYYCGSPATTREHVPPRALFPKLEDTPSGTDYRKDLVSVPSCVTHNNATSRDDEYLLYVLAMGFPANDVGKNQFLTKVLRAIKERPSLLKGMLQSKEQVTVHDTVANEWSATIAFQVDDSRLHAVLEKIVRALYFHESQTVWNGEVQVLVEFTLKLDDPSFNDEVRQVSTSADAVLAGAPLLGVHPDVFSYQTASIDGTHMYRLKFYAHLSALCILTVPAAG